MPLEGFLKFEGIEGECKDAEHPQWIDVTGFEWSMSQEASPAPDGTLAAGTPTVQSFQFQQPYSRASVPLFLACCTGRQFPTATFEGRLRNGDSHFTFMHVDFKDCLVTSVQTSSEGARVTEQIEVVFRSINIRAEERPL